MREAARPKTDSPAERGFTEAVLMHRNDISISEPEQVESLVFLFKVAGFVLGLDHIKVDMERVASPSMLITDSNYSPTAESFSVVREQSKQAELTPDFSSTLCCSWTKPAIVAS